MNLGWLAFNFCFFLGVSCRTLTLAAHHSVEDFFRVAANAALEQVTCVLDQDSDIDTKEKQLCQPQKNIVFLKTHKCASGTIKNILMRYADKHNLTVVIPRRTYYLGHSEKFRPDMAIPLPSAFSDHYNILTHHTLWHKDNIKSIMPRDTIYISSVREPATMYEALYNWTKLDKTFGVPIETFVTNPRKYYVAATSYGRNPMLFDLGLEKNDFDNPVKIQNVIDDIDQNFSLVLVVDYMFESLVLLRQLMCWTWQDVVVFQLNVRQTSHKKQLSTTVKDQIRYWNAGDVKLYNHFRKRLLQQIEEYGQDRMQADVQKLRALTREWYQFCIERKMTAAEKGDPRFKIWHPSSTGYVVTPAGLKSEMCIRFAMLGDTYTDVLRQKLWPNYGS